MILGLYSDPANSTSKCSDFLPDRKWLSGHSLVAVRLFLRFKDQLAVLLSLRSYYWHSNWNKSARLINTIYTLCQKDTMYSGEGAYMKDNAWVRASHYVRGVLLWLPVSQTQQCLILFGIMSFRPRLISSVLRRPMATEAQLQSVRACILAITTLHNCE